MATNLVPGDTNTVQDIFIRDRRTGVTRRISVSSGGAQGNAFSQTGTISANGRSVAFDSEASNLVPGDTNAEDVFVRDRRARTTERVSLGPRGVQGNVNGRNAVLSADGRFVAFVSDSTNLVSGDSNGQSDVFVRDREMRTTERVSLGPRSVQSNFFSFAAAISADGRYVAFSSLATNLVPGDTNGAFDVFVRDRRTRVTRRVSVSSGGAQGNGTSIGAALSADGRIVAFGSGASNLVPNDTNDAGDVFVRVPLD